MRIISQDGTLDLPYEGIGITTGHKGDVKEFYIFAHLVNSAEPKKDPQKLGTYSTEAKAKKAMEMLRDKYTHIKRIECLSGSLASQISTLSAEDAKLLGDEVQELMCFRFPADEDVEV